MEYLDVLNEDGSLTGTSKLRSDVHRDGDWHRAVHVWVINDNWEVLAQQRSFQKDSFAGLWTIGAGGHVSSGKNSTETAVEELWEECGLKINGDDLLFRFSYPLQNREQDGQFVNNTIIDAFTIRLDVSKADIKIQPEEVEDVKFISLDEVDRVIRSADPNYHHLDQEHAPMLQILRREAEKIGNE